jgi:hypothetical protein
MPTLRDIFWGRAMTFAKVQSSFLAKEQNHLAVAVIISSLQPKKRK